MMFEDKLPPVVKKKADINKEYRQKCDEWCDLVYDNLDIYADFVRQENKRYGIYQYLASQDSN